MADKVAVVAVVGGVQQAQVVMPLLAVQLHAVGLVQGAVSDGRVVVAVPVGPDPVQRGPRRVNLEKMRN